MISQDIIVALSTPPGEGAIGVVRLSGKGCIGLVNSVFKGKDLTEVDGYTIHFGEIKDGDHLIDEVLVSVFRAPKSYTKEDVVEISCHGSSYIIQRLIQLFIKKGARTAKRGEFTMRAFLNGQMDLSQAEAVMDLISSDSESSHEMAMRQMRGGFSEEIKELRQELIDFAALIELELDFGEEDVEFADRGKLKDLVNKITNVIKKLLDSFQLGNVIKNGVNTAIIGRPNAGKSTLLNALLNEDRAIVSDIAGTTRDTIEEVMNIKGIQFRMVDTAGIRQAQDAIESIGVEKALAHIQKSVMVIHLVDVSTTTPEEVWSDMEDFKVDREQFLLVLNKMDKNPSLDISTYYNDIINAQNTLSISAVNKTNIDDLKEMLYQRVISDPTLLDGTIVNNSRHYDALLKSHQSLTAVLDGLSSGVTGDFIAMDIRQSLHHLGEITGEISSEDLLDSIFGRFCIGK